MRKILLIAILLLSVTACGKDSGKNPDETQPEKPEVNLNNLELDDERFAEIIESISEDSEQLFLTGNSITDISPLKKFTKLQTLLLSGGNEISDLSPLSGLTELRDLQLSFNPVSDISPIEGLNNLTYLGAIYCQLSDISPLAELESLQYLYLSNNQITDISPLFELKKLSVLDISGNDGIKQEQIDALKEALPRCEIISDLQEHETQQTETQEQIQEEIIE